MERGENKETMTNSFNVLLMTKHFLMLREYRKMNLMCQDGIIDKISGMGLPVRCCRNHYCNNQSTAKTIWLIYREIQKV